MTEKETVGAQALKLLEKADGKQSLMDTSLEMTKNFMPEISKCIDNHKYLTEPYYLIAINKRERLIINSIRQFFAARRTLPTPDYDQNVFKYFPSSGGLKYLWTVPDKDSVTYILLNQTSLPDEQKELLKFCKLFIAGTLDKVCGE